MNLKTRIANTKPKLIIEKDTSVTDANYKNLCESVARLHEVAHYLNEKKDKISINTHKQEINNLKELIDFSLEKITPKETIATQ